MKAENILHVLVDDPGNAQRGRHLKQVRRKSLVETANALIAERLLGDIHEAGVGRRVHCRSLCLEAGTEHIEGVDDASAERP